MPLQVKMFLRQNETTPHISIGCTGSLNKAFYLPTCNIQNKFSRITLFNSLTDHLVGCVRFNVPPNTL